MGWLPLPITYVYAAAGTIRRAWLVAAGGRGELSVHREPRVRDPHLGRHSRATSSKGNTVCFLINVR